MKLRLVTVAGDPELETMLAEQVGNRADVDLLMRCMDKVEVLAVLRARHPDAVLVTGSPPWLDEAFSEEAAAYSARVVCIGEGDGMRRMERLGATVIPAAASVNAVLEACRRPAHGARVTRASEKSAERGQIIAVWGPKGAPGRTTLALELASHSAALRRSTLLVDADPYGGDLIQVLAIVEELPTVIWASRLAARDELEQDAMTEMLRRIGSEELFFLPGLARAELWGEVSERGWHRLLARVKDLFPWSILDVGFSIERPQEGFERRPEERNLMTRASLEMADRVVAVCRGDPVGIKQFLWGWQELIALVEAARVVTVVNRSEDRHRAEITRILEQHTGAAPLAHVPGRPADVRRAHEMGLPIREAVPGSAIVPPIRDVAEALGGIGPARGFMTRVARLIKT